MELLSQGAEAKVYGTIFLNRPSVCKVRQQKRYRVSELDDRINKQRLLHEARCIAKCKRSGVPAPCLYFVDTDFNALYMERIFGESLKSRLLSHHEDFRADELAQEVGKAIAMMHDAEIVHGDLTTSNILLRSNDRKLDIVLIDFGLGSMKPSIEEKAVDLYVLERAFISTHPGSERLVERLLEHYRFNSKKGTSVLLKLDQVRQRGRKREMIG